MLGRGLILIGLLRVEGLGVTPDTCEALVDGVTLDDNQDEKIAVAETLKAAAELRLAGCSKYVASDASLRARVVETCDVGDNDDHLSKRETDACVRAIEALDSEAVAELVQCINERERQCGQRRKLEWNRLTSGGEILVEAFKFLANVNKVVIDELTIPFIKTFIADTVDPDPLPSPASPPPPPWTPEKCAKLTSISGGDLDDEVARRVAPIGGPICYAWKREVRGRWSCAKSGDTDLATLLGEQMRYTAGAKGKVYVRYNVSESDFAYQLVKVRGNQSLSEAFHPVIKKISDFVNWGFDKHSYTVTPAKSAEGGVELSPVDCPRCCTCEFWDAMCGATDKCEYCQLEGEGQICNMLGAKLCTDNSTISTRDKCSGQKMDCTK